jgi:hypothetical protein
MACCTANFTFPLPWTVSQCTRFTLRRDKIATTSNFVELGPSSEPNRPHAYARFTAFYKIQDLLPRHKCRPRVPTLSHINPIDVPYPDCVKKSKFHHYLRLSHLQSVLFVSGLPTKTLHAVHAPANSSSFIYRQNNIWPKYKP